MYIYIPEDPREVAADKWDLNYVGLDGNVSYICVRMCVCVCLYVCV